MRYKYPVIIIIIITVIRKCYTLTHSHEMDLFVA